MSGLFAKDAGSFFTPELLRTYSNELRSPGKLHHPIPKFFRNARPQKIQTHSFTGFSRAHFRDVVNS
jgi:hypothetical protein